MLDASGSIEEVHFEQMKDAITLLTPNFCSVIQVAVMKFSNHVDLEFCFNCFDNDKLGRKELVDAIKNIEYVGGSTSTGVSAKCVYENLFDQTFRCGIHSSSKCIDVVFITDGNSNGPLKYPNVCEQVDCLRSHPTYGPLVKVYAIAVGDDVRQKEIDCIAGDDQESVFKVQNFTHFLNLTRGIWHEIHVNKSAECVYSTRKFGDKYETLATSE